MKYLVAIILILLTGTIQGCATLSKSECRKADWRIIGLEDGSAGRPVTYIGRHRKSCAEYGVRPNMDRYQLGHSEGVRIFCRPRKGFELGKSGRSHQDVCPADLHDAYTTAYDNGRKVYDAKQAMNHAKKQVEVAQTGLKEISTQIITLESRLVSSEGSSDQRQAWLDEIKQLQQEQERDQSNLRRLQHQARNREREYESLNNRFHY